MNTPSLVILCIPKIEEASFIRDAIFYIRPGIQIKLISTGDELLPLLKTWDPNNLPLLMVLDLHAFRSNAADLTAILKARKYRKIPKILLVEKTSKPVDDLIKAGAKDFLVKPGNLFDWEKIAQLLLDYMSAPIKRKQP